MVYLDRPSTPIISPVPVNAKSIAEPPAPDEDPSELAAPEPFLAAAFKVIPAIVFT